MSTALSGVTDVQSTMAGIQARIDSIGARFGLRPAGMAFADQLSRSSEWQGVRRASGAGDLALDGVSGEDILTVGRQFLGVPYVWGGTDPSGFDCSGFLQYVFRQFGLELPRVSRDQSRSGQPVASLAQALPGDLVAFGSPVDHIGIYAGNGQMIVAPKSGDVVKMQTITQTPSAIRRVLHQPVAAVPAVPSLPDVPGGDLLATLLAERSGALAGLGLEITNAQGVS